MLGNRSTVDEQDRRADIWAAREIQSCPCQVHSWQYDVDETLLENGDGVVADMECSGERVRMPGA